MVAAAVFDDAETGLSAYVQSLTSGDYASKPRTAFFVYSGIFDPEKSVTFLSAIVHEKVHVKDISGGLPQKIAKEAKEILQKNLSQEEFETLEEQLDHMIMESRAHIVQAEFERKRDSGFDATKFVSEKMSMYLETVAFGLQNVKDKESNLKLCKLLKENIPHLSKYQKDVYDAYLPQCSPDNQNASQDFSVRCMTSGNANCPDVKAGLSRVRVVYDQNRKVKKILSWPSDVPDFIQDAVKEFAVQKEVTDSLWKSPTCTCTAGLENDYRP
jgi:hypothetical protein